MRGDRWRDLAQIQASSRRRRGRHGAAAGLLWGIPLATGDSLRLRGWEGIGRRVLACLVAAVPWGRRLPERDLGDPAPSHRPMPARLLRRAVARTLGRRRAAGAGAAGPRRGAAGQGRRGPGSGRLPSRRRHAERRRRPRRPGRRLHPGAQWAGAVSAHGRLAVARDRGRAELPHPGQRLRHSPALHRVRPALRPARRVGAADRGLQDVAGVRRAARATAADPKPQGRRRRRPGVVDRCVPATRRRAVSAARPSAFGPEHIPSRRCI